MPASTPRSRRTGASSPSSRWPPTWCPATPTARPTSSSATARRARLVRISLGPGGVQGNGQQLRPGDLGGRALRRLLLVRHQPGAGRHQRHGRRVRPRPPDGHDPAGEPRAGRRPGQRAAASSPALSADGRFVAFGSDASNLVPGDTNNLFDVFVHDRQSGTTQRVSVGPGGVQANGFSVGPTLSADGRFVAFDSSATNLVPGDTNGVWTCSSATGRPARRGGSASASDGAQGDGRQLARGDLGGRAVRRLRLRRHQPGAGRHQRRATCSSATARRARPDE